MRDTSMKTLNILSDIAEEETTEDLLIAMEDQDFKSFLKDCEEWENPEDNFMLNSTTTCKSYKRCKVPVFDFLELKKVTENSLENTVQLGPVINNRTLSKKPISFKYHLGGQPSVFCNYVMKPLMRNKQEKKCCDPKCKYAHSFLEVKECDGKCGRINLENNYFSGPCMKRHHRETKDNFLIRKNIKIPNYDTLTLEFFRKPSEEFVRDVLKTATKLGYTDLSLKIIPEIKILTLDEFYSARKSDIIDQSEDNLITQEEFDKLWAW